MWKIIFIDLLLFYSSAVSKNIAIDSNINAGSEATPHQFPFAVVVRSRNINFSPRLCGGALISRQSILTSAFCVFEQIDIEVFLGAHNLEVNEPFQVRMPIPTQDVRIHPEFSRGSMISDLAILRLPSPIGFFNHAINLIAIPTNPDETFSDFSSTVIGWGSDCGLPTCLPSNILKQVEVFVRQNTECAGIGLTQSSQLCATSTLGGPCNGDWGGPQFITRNGNFLLIGIVQTVGNFCRGAAIYTRITSFIPWIRENM